LIGNLVHREVRGGPLMDLGDDHRDFPPAMLHHAQDQLSQVGGHLASVCPAHEAKKPPLSERLPEVPQRIEWIS
jgi:hypothetical protein